MVAGAAVLQRSSCLPSHISFLNPCTMFINWIIRLGVKSVWRKRDFRTNSVSVSSRCGIGGRWGV